MTQIIKNLKKMDLFNKNPEDPTLFYYKKFFLYSAHDTNMITMMDNIGIIERQCMYKSLIAGETAEESKCRAQFPEFGSNIIFENIFDTKEKLTYIATKYNGKYYRVCPED
jgi:hypothetical protein